MRLLTSQIALATGGAVVGADVIVDEFRHDSREVVGGEMFVPVRGVRDGHRFIGAALDAGAAAYLCSRSVVDDVAAMDGTGSSTAVVVDDPELALTALAAWVRAERLPERVVGITGSVGKTSAKDLTAAALGRRWLTSASLRSFNNELGVPLTVLNAPDGTEALVVEMGARGIGHIASLATYVQPTIGIVTAVELVHAEMMGGLDGIARAKSELVASLPSSGTAVLNGANPRVAAMAAVTGARVLRFGVDAEPGLDLVADELHLDDDLRPSFVLRTPWGSAPVRLAVRGAHQVGNALAAAGAALAADVSLDDVAAGLAEAELSPWRMELGRTPSGARVINDAYNAGPASVEAAMRSLCHLRAARRIAVLGPMAELGDHEVEQHQRIATLAAELGIAVIAVDAQHFGRGAGVVHVGDIDAAEQALGTLSEADAVLVKGSRVAGLERLVHRLLG
jgi:UDP-N-acetylmuramoyl-tripeptide--D-alanyl-D-alanine ligase